MFDDSLVDYMLRMQGRSVSVRMDGKLANLGTPTVQKEKDISQALRRRLSRFQESWLPRLNVEAPRVRIDLISFTGIDDEREAQNYMLLSRYPSLEQLHAQRIENPLDLWAGRLGYPPHAWDTDDVQIGTWVNLTQNVRDRIDAKLNDWLFNKYAKLYKLDMNDEDTGWNSITRATIGYEHFISVFTDGTDGDRTGYAVTSIRSMVVGRDTAIDYELLGKHMVRANMFWHDYYDHGVTWEGLSYSSEPTYAYIEYEEDQEATPPFPKLIFAEHLYKAERTDLGAIRWNTHPKSQFMAREHNRAFDGEWYTYHIPSVDLKSDDITILKDFQDFLRRKLVS